MRLLSPVLILEDDEIMQMRLIRLLLDLGYLRDDICLKANLHDFKHHTDFHTIKLALLDLGLPDGSGLEAIQKLREMDADLPIVVISAWSTENMLIQALQAGANGYILKERDDLELLVSIRSILRGGSPIDPGIAQFLLNQFANEFSASKPIPSDATAESSLTEREREILQWVAVGLSNQEIAKEVHLSRFTVETHIRHVYRKLAVKSRTTAILKAKNLGLL